MTVGVARRSRAFAVACALSASPVVGIPVSEACPSAGLEPELSRLILERASIEVAEPRYCRIVHTVSGTKDPDHVVSAAVDSLGVLRFTVATGTLGGPMPERAIRAEMETATSWLRLQGHDLRTIEDVMLPGAPGSSGSDLERVNARVMLGIPAVEAVVATPVGRFAQANGYVLEDGLRLVPGHADGAATKGRPLFGTDTSQFPYARIEARYVWRPSPEAKRVVKHERPDYRVVEDSTNPGNFFRASWNKGVLSFSVVTQRVDGGYGKGVEHTGVIRAGEELDDALRFFATQGHPVDAISGDWSFGRNLSEFHRALSEGKTPEEAALSTWTGKRAARNGYTRAQVDRMDSAEVRVRFLKP